MRYSDLSTLWDRVRFIIVSGWRDLVGTDFSQVKYTEVNFALYLAGVLAGFILLKLVLPRILSYFFGRNRTKYSQKVSGHSIPREYERGYFYGFIFFLPKLALVIPLAAIFFALADPFFPLFRNEAKYVETRIRIDIRDVSSSMGATRIGDESRGEVAHKAHLEFLKMRLGKGDRTSYWIFSNNAYLMQNFTVDEDLYYQQVYDSPWEIGSTNPEEFNQWDSYPTPKSRYQLVVGEGGTVISSSLRSVLEQLKDDEARQNNPYSYRSTSKALLILTDAGISDFSEAVAYIEELRKKKVIIYLIMISGPETSPSPILIEIEKSGGKYFYVSSPDSILKAYQQIDQLEKTKVELQRIIYKISLFYKFIYIAIMALILIIPIGLFFQLWEHI